MKNDFGEKLSILSQSMSFVVSTPSKKKYVDASPDPDSGSLDDSSGSEGDAGEEDISAAFTDIDGKCDDKVVGVSRVVKDGKEDVGNRIVDDGQLVSESETCHGVESLNEGNTGDYVEETNLNVEVEKFVDSNVNTGGDGGNKGSKMEETNCKVCFEFQASQGLLYVCFWFIIIFLF